MSLMSPCNEHLLTGEGPVHIPAAQAGLSVLLDILTAEDGAVQPKSNTLNRFRAS